MFHIAEDHPSSSYTPLLQKYVTDGVWWDSYTELQHSMTLHEKGWRVKVYWADDFEDGQYIGLGVFAGENIPKGTVMRVAEIGVNIVLFNRTTNLPPLHKVEKSKMADTDVDGKKTADHLKNYGFKCPCHVGGGGDDMMVFLPGNAVNHRIGGNTGLLCRKNGTDVIALRDITEGEPLRSDYNTFGRAPRWYTEVLKESLGTDECTFAGLNEYVG